MPTANGAQPTFIGRTLGGRYAVEHVLGTGAMGTVYRARDTERDTRVAIKVLHPRLATDPAFVQRFEREAFASSRLDHPNALRVLDFGVEGDLFYLVTEYVDAEDLLTLMEAEWPLGDERAVCILSQVLSALVAVHDLGIVHRDLKPENILVLAGRDDDGKKVDVVKVCDFGIAKVARSDAPKSRRFARRLTAEGAVVGTPDYMSPEQARGEPVDGRSDLYSVGVVLYHLLAGRTPFEADSPVAIALQHVSEAPVPPSRYRNVSPGLEAVCLRALSKRPEERFQTAREMRKALRDALTPGAQATALMRASPAALRVGSSSSTSSPAALSLWRLSEALTHVREWQSGRRRRHPSLGYVAAASIAMVAAAFVASRAASVAARSGAPDDVQETMTLVSPPSTQAHESLTSEPVADTEPIGSATERPEASVRIAAAEPRAPARAPSPPATRARPHGIVVAVRPPALPISSGPTTREGPVLVRSDPWPTAAEGSPTTAPVNASAPSPPPTALAAAAPAKEPPELRPSAAPVVADGAASRSPTPPPRAAAPRAALAIGNIATSAGISANKIKTGLAHAPILACYRQAIAAVSQRAVETTFETELRLTIDFGGRVVQAVLARDGGLAGLRGCIESGVRGASIRDVDTGDGTAMVQLRFSVR